MNISVLFARALGILAATLCLTGSPGFAETVAAALSRGDLAAARRIAEAEIKGRPDAPLLRAHLEGLIALRKGDYVRASTIFREILAAKPDFTPAREELEKIAKIGGKAPANAQRTLQSAKRNHGVGLRFALLPSSNLTGGTTEKIVVIGGLPFTLDASSRAASGVGLSFGLTGWQQWQLSQAWQLRLQADADARLYETAVKPDEAEIGLQLNLIHRDHKAAVSFGPRLNLLWQGGDLYQQQAGLGFSMETKLSPRLSFGVAGSWLAQDYPTAGYRDGFKTDLSTNLRWLASPSLLLSAGLFAQRETTQAAHLTHSDIGLTLVARKQISRNTILGVDLFAGHASYDTAFPVFGFARQDDTLRIGISLQDQRISWHGITPEFTVSRKHQSSNIPFYDAWSTDFALNLTKRF
jgi:outer membrane protein